MAVTVSEVQTAVTEIQGIADTAATTVGALDPAAALDASTAAALVNVLAQLAQIALTALSKAQSTAITAASIAALDVDQTPLT